MKRPLLPVALIYVSGILFADLFPLSLRPLLFSSLALVLVSLFWTRARLLLLGPLIVLCGSSNLTLHKAIISPVDLRVVIGERSEYLTIRGILCETPEQRLYEHGDEKSWRTMGRIDVNALCLGKTNAQPVVGRVAVSTAGLLPPDFASGQTVEITGIIRPPKGPLANGLFDYRTYLSRLGIYYQLQVVSTNDWQLLSRPLSPSLADRFRPWAQSTLARGLPVEDEPLRLLWAMTLGWKTALTGEISEPFMRSGTMHIFAISGLHIALISGILVSLLRVFQVPRSVCGVLVIPLIWSYTGLTGWQASAIRSTIMMTVIIAGWSLKRPGDLLNSLAAAAVIILIWDPQQLFQASFQLSFSVVLSLALFTPVLERIRKTWSQPDPFLPAETRSRWPKWMERPAHYISLSFTTSLAAWLGSIPLVAYYFHLFTPVSLLANLVVVPLSSLALMSNLASLMTGSWFPACTEIFNHSAWFWMLLMVRVSEWAAQVPGGSFYVATPAPITFLVYYALLVSVMAGWVFKSRIRLAVITGLSLLATLWLIHWQKDRSTARLTILPLNGGEAIYCDPAGSGRNWLIDCGDQSSAEFVTKPFLRAQGVDRLSHLLLTHGDLRNVGGAELVRQSFSVQKVLMSPTRFRSPAYRILHEKFRRTPGLTKIITAGDRSGPWTVLHPSAEDQFPQADDNTVVLRGDIRGTRVLLLSDLGKPGQNALMNRVQDLRADIVVAGLPHQTEPLADALLEAIQPNLIIITDAEFPATERASLKLRERLARKKIPMFCTRETGAVTLLFTRSGWRMQALNGMELSHPK